MTHMRVGLQKLPFGGDAEIYGQHNGEWFGRIGAYPAKWDYLGKNVSSYGSVPPCSSWDIPAPAPVKKWRWVVQSECGSYLFLTDCHYHGAEEAAKEQPGIHGAALYRWKAVQKIDATETEA